MGRICFPGFWLPLYTNSSDGGAAQERMCSVFCHGGDSRSREGGWTMPGDQCHELKICLSANVRLAGVKAKAVARKSTTGSPFFFFSSSCFSCCIVRHHFVDFVL